MKFHELKPNGNNFYGTCINTTTFTDIYENLTPSPPIHSVFIYLIHTLWNCMLFDITPLGNLGFNINKKPKTRKGYR
jgi:hypothetical protein